MAEVLTVLVASGDPAVFRRTRVLVEALGHRVRTASCGGEALRDLARHRSDLVLADRTLSDMSGLRLAETLFETSADRVPVVIVGEDPLDGADSSLLVTDVVAAPITRDVLVATLKRIA